MAKHLASYFLTAVTVLLAATSCFAETSEPEAESILVQIIGSKYTTLVKLLADADLLSELETDKRFNEGATVFATSDEYFSNKVDPSVLEFLQQPSNNFFLRQVLLSHIVPGKVGAHSWYPGETVSTFSGSEARLHLDAGDLKVNDAVVKEFGVLEAADGVVHALDGFLIPEGVEDYIQREVSLQGRREIIEFTSSEKASMTSMAPAPGPSPAITFEQALGDLNATLPELVALIGSYPAVVAFLQDLITSGTPITLFAPSNAAVQGANLTGLDVPLVLKNHVAQGTYTYDDLLNLAAGGGASRRLLQSNVIQTYANDSLTLTKDADGNLLVNNVTVDKGDLMSYSKLSAIEINGILVPEKATVSTGTSPPPPPPGSGAKFGVSVLLVLASLAVGSVLVL